MRANRNPAMDLALIAVFAALIVLFSVVTFPMPGTGVPLTLQVLAIGLAGMVLGPWRGFAATLLYLLVGFAGLPVFARGASTVAVLGTPTAGYLIAFPIFAGFVGLCAQLIVRRANTGLRAALLLVAAILGRFLVIFPIGAAGIARNVPMAYGKAVKADALFWLGDCIKLAAAAVIAVAVHKAFPQLLAARPGDVVEE